MKHALGVTPAGVACVLALSAAADVSAQGQTVIPPAFAGNEGNSQEQEPFGFDEIRHLQYVDQKLLYRVPRTVSLTEIAYRRDGLFQQSITLKRELSPGVKPQPVWRVRLGNYGGSVSNPPAQFPAENDPAWTVVFTPKQVSFPNLTVPPFGRPPFVIEFPFDAPFVFAGPHLGVEHRGLDPAAGTYVYLVDAVRPPTAGGRVQLISPTSLGCPAGANRVTGIAPTPGAGNLLLRLAGGAARVPAIFFLGSSKTSWNGWPLPLSLAPFGLSGCHVHTEPGSGAPTVTSSAGTASVQLPVPPNPDLLGAVLYSQVLLLNDPRVNPIVPITLSDGVEVTLGADPNAAAYLMSVVQSRLVSASFGLIERDHGLVFELSW